MSIEKSAAARLVAAYEGTLAAHLPPAATVCVALSGGMDSCVLLHVALQRRQRWRVSACHVNHGISQHAKHWEAFCRDWCQTMEVPLTVHRATPSPRENVSEEWARTARLQAFAQLPAAAVITAHHADDQAETVLFRLLRGSGVHGIAAMDASAMPANIKILRPWLEVERQCIADYASVQRLRWVEDEDNRNLSRQRNFLRWRTLPTLAQGFSDCNRRLAAAGRRLREGSQLLLQLAAQDEAAARQADGGLAIAYFRAVGEARTRNWLYRCLVERRQHFSERLIIEAARQILNSKQEMCFHLQTFSLRRWRDALYWEKKSPPPPPGFAQPIKAVAGQTPLAALGGRLVLTQTLGGGLSPLKTGENLLLRLRRGGERLTPPRRCPHTVASLLQEAAVFPWRRQRLPLLFVGERLVAVAGVAVAAEFAAAADEIGIECRFEWA